MSILDQQYTGLAYIGRKMLRADDEPKFRGNDDYESREQYTSNWPEARPHVFVQLDEGISLREALVTPSASLVGSSSVLVDYQKEVRDKSTPAEVNAWRDRFTLERLPSIDSVDNLTDENLETVYDRIEGTGEPYVVINADEVSLDVPMQPADMLKKIRWAEDKLGTDLLDEDPSDAEVRQMFETVKEIVES